MVQLPAHFLHHGILAAREQQVFQKLTGHMLHQDAAAGFRRSFAVKFRRAFSELALRRG